MNLKQEKAKTIAELNSRGKDQYCRGCYQKDSECSKCFWNTQKWVLVSVAQRGIDERNLTIEALRNTLKRERLELKQKLRQLHIGIKEIEAIIWAICEPDSLGRKKMEECLKEFEGLCLRNEVA